MSRSRPQKWLRSAALVLPCLAFASSASADLGSVRTEVADVESAAGQLSLDSLRRQDLRSSTYVEERLTDGELFYRLKDYVRAAIIFTDIVENHPNHAASADALFLLGDSLYRANDYLGARTRLKSLLDRAGEPGFASYVPRALGRLIEIAIHTRDFDGVEEYFERLSRLPPREVEAATNYFRAKFLYNRAVATEDLLLARDGEEAAAVDASGLEQSRQAFEAVAESSPYYSQARYFVGVILTIQRQYPAAIEAFRRVLRAPATSPEAARVVELSQLALGRLYYETDQLDQAVEAYQAVSRNSVSFDVALYEIAWVYIRMGDATRADRALEVLSVAVPDSRYQADAQILRGNLLLREGRLPEATTVFDTAIATYRPIREQLDDVIRDHEEPILYFRELVRQNIDVFDASTIVPPEALKFASEEAHIDRALRVLSDLNQARTLVREATDIIQRLDAAITSPNRVNVFADLRRQRQKTTSLRNRAAGLRGKLIAIEEQRQPAGGGELSDVRTKRRQLGRSLNGMPTEDSDYNSRDEELLGDFRGLKKQIAGLEVELLGLRARIVATERFLEDTEAERDSPEGVKAVMDELATQRNALAEYDELIREYKIALEAGQSQVGVGDARYRRDEDLRNEYNELVARERSLMAAQGSRADPETDNLYRRLEAVEALALRRDQEIESVLEERIANMRGTLEEESTNVEGYRAQLAELEEESEEVVGGVAYNSFAAVRHRFYDLVLRADVGKIDVSWADREEHRMRVELLSRERARELKALDNEFREIMDKGDGGGQ